MFNVWLYGFVLAGAGVVVVQLVFTRISMDGLDEMAQAGERRVFDQEGLCLGRALVSLNLLLAAALRAGQVAVFDEIVVVDVRPSYPSG